MLYELTNKYLNLLYTYDDFILTILGGMKNIENIVNLMVINFMENLHEGQPEHAEKMNPKNESFLYHYFMCSYNFIFKVRKEITHKDVTRKIEIVK